MLQDIERLPRSISETGDWSPDWRNCQAMGDVAGGSIRHADATAGLMVRHLGANLEIPRWMGGPTGRNSEIARRLDKKVAAACKRLGIICGQPAKRRSSKVVNDWEY